MKGFNLKTGISFEQTNLTGYNESRVMTLACPICGNGFHRPPSHVGRVKGTVTCSRGCAAVARRVRIEAFCVSCGASMDLKPSDAARITTCSKGCSTLRRIKDINNINPYGIGEYKKAAKDIAKRRDCCNCGSDIGPWVIRNLGVAVSPDGEVSLSLSDAQLWCNHCHLEGIAKRGGVARTAQRRNKKARL